MQAQRGYVSGKRTLIGVICVTQSGPINMVVREGDHPSLIGSTKDVLCIHPRRLVVFFLNENDPIEHFDDLCSYGWVARYDHSYDLTVMHICANVYQLPK